MILVLVLAVLPPVSWGEPLYQHPRLPGQQPAQEDEDRAKIEKDMAKKANQQRQADLKRDTDKLLKLATELQQYVDKSNENVLSLEVIKKAEEIEKLAHSVKEKMKGSN
ncbi:MAG: hypothetical protein LAN63_16830 [Acidobacteriia bacterium]|nr:hypothetical protein [Terriglobia bacterium]